MPALLIIEMAKGILGKILELWCRRGGGGRPGQSRANLRSGEVSVKRARGLDLPRTDRPPRFPCDASHLQVTADQLAERGSCSDLITPRRRCRSGSLPSRCRSVELPR
jgi:hypothetical protein